MPKPVSEIQRQILQAISSAAPDSFYPKWSSGPVVERLLSRGLLAESPRGYKLTPAGKKVMAIRWRLLPVWHPAIQSTSPFADLDIELQAMPTPTPPTPRRPAPTQQADVEVAEPAAAAPAPEPAPPQDACPGAVA